MLPTNYRQAYESFLRKLEDFSVALLDEDSPTGSKLFQALQTCLEKEVLSLNDDNLAAEVANRWRPIQTELYRSWRLLETDWLFLATARQGREKRLQIISDRVATLKHYCQVLLGEVVH